MQRLKSSWILSLVLLTVVGWAPVVRADDGARRVGLQLTLGSVTGAALGVATFAATVGLFTAGKPKNDAGRMVLGILAAIPLSVVSYTAGTAAGVHWGGNLMGEGGGVSKGVARYSAWHARWGCSQLGVVRRAHGDWESPVPRGLR
jgi:hypothetical protein